MKQLSTGLEKYFFQLSILSWLLGFAYDAIITIKNSRFDALDWKITQFHVSYWEFGFVKRGVVGSITSPIFSLLQLKEAGQIAFIIAIDAALFLMFVALIHKSLKSEQVCKKSITLIRAILIFSPVGFMQWSFDIGRLDHFVYILLFWACNLLIKKKFFQVGFTLAFSTLVHEVTFLFGSAAILIVLASFRNKKTAKCMIAELSAIFLPALTIFVAIIIFGNIESEVLLAQLSESAIGRGAEVWRRGALDPNLRLSLFQYFIIVSYALAVLITFFQHFKNAVGIFFTAGAFALLALLYLAGADYSRWVHASFISFTIASVFLMQQSQNLVEHNRGILQKLSIFLLILPLGPIGIVDGLPYLARILGYARKLVMA